METRNEDGGHPPGNALRKLVARGGGKGLRRGARAAVITAETLVLLGCVGVVALVLRQGHPATSAASASHHLVQKQNQDRPFPAYSVPPQAHLAKPPVFPGSGGKGKPKGSRQSGYSTGGGAHGGAGAGGSTAGRPGAGGSTAGRPGAGGSAAAHTGGAAGSSPARPSSSPSTKSNTADPAQKPSAVSSPPASSTAQVEITGQVNCLSGKSITGFWVQTENGRDSGWASWRQVDSGPNADYWYFMPAGESYKLSVGCGGTQQSWAVTTYTGSVSGTHNSFHCNDIAGTKGYGTCVPR
jgi:hypothetical protein